MTGIEGQIALVTGAAQGNGAAIAQGLAEAGARVVLADLRADGLEETRERILAVGGEAIACTLDVTNPQEVADLAVHVRQEMGQTAILVNNAGIIRRTPIDADSFDADWTQTFAVNVEAPQRMVRAFLPDLQATQGRVVMLGSIMSVAAGANLSAYVASKGAIAQLTKALANELAPRGIRVNAILPGVIDTPMTADTRANPDAISKFMGHTPMGRVGQPQELVGPVLFLASAASSYVTGALLPVDGGYLTA